VTKKDPDPHQNDKQDQVPHQGDADSLEPASKFKEFAGGKEGRKARGSLDFSLCTYTYSMPVYFPIAPTRLYERHFSL
jgi:hypothetical protein